MKHLFRRSGNALIAEDDEAADYLKKTANGEAVEVEITRPRNLQFHRKYFALLKVGYEAWEENRPDVFYKGEKVQANFERFRKDVAIMCGFYEIVVNVKNETRLDAKSISFAKMTEDEFTKLYDKTINLLLQRVLSKDWDEAKLRETVEQIVRF